ncbi:M1 family peptidase [Erythrobacter arachoides]|uniref:M1 family peptidase n=1 Tax=Aurantiacibacter arachoides TaxID=1850444 RepID=A0A845A4V6_9SPHN|nr:M1 family metallopeptidase [Aurantiacibacter arachoides]MXO94674.1 M1 family peptidase [Aurantiacibacter arachoides]GGD61567.1 peptidase M1 [Aurantiacibacter arachoides]
MMPRQLAVAGALALFALPPAASAQDAPPIAERTAQSDLPLEGPRAATRIGHASLSISVTPATRSIAGRALHQVVALSDTAQLQFDLDPRFAISEIVVDDVAVPASGWRNPDGLLTIDLPRPLGAGERALVSIMYTGVPHVATNPPWDGGFTWATTPGGEPWIATSIQGEGCDMFWPCIDHSSHRSDSLDLMVTVPDGLVAAGNGRLVAERDNGNGTTTFHWQARDPSNYGITLQIGPYELAERTYRSRYGNEIPLMFWHLPGHGEEAERLLGELADQVRFFEEVVGPYPFADEKAGVAETPHLGMEHQTINAYGNAFRRDPLGYDWLLAHEFAHEWFANQLTHASINHMWLHEGIGTWMQPLYLGWARGQMYYDAAMWENRKAIVSRVPLVPPEGQLPDYNDRAAGWGTDIYYKGAWIMHTLRALVGEEVLSPALTELTYGTTDPQPGAIRPVNRTTEDFRRILQAHGAGDLDWFFDAYFHQAALPRLEARQEGTTLSLAWQTPSAMPFAMPVEVRVGDSIVTVPMAEGRGDLSLPDAGTSWLADPRNLVLKQDDAIDAWRAAERRRGD